MSQATKRIEGRRGFGGLEVLVVPLDGGQPRPLPTTPIGRRHSPDGFEWGYGGSGPSALAHAILVECGVPAEDAERLYQRFKGAVVAAMAPAYWQLLDCDVREWVRQHAG